MLAKSLPSLVRRGDKRDKADEILTAVLPLNTLARPGAAHPRSAHMAAHYEHHERKQICLCLLTHSHPPQVTLAVPVAICKFQVWLFLLFLWRGVWIEPTAFLFFFLVPLGFLAFSMTAYRAKHRRLMRGRSATLMSNSSLWSHSGSERTVTSELVTTLQRSSLPWNRPACTTSWKETHTQGAD